MEVYSSAKTENISYLWTGEYFWSFFCCDIFSWEYLLVWHKKAKTIPILLLKEYLLVVHVKQGIAEREWLNSIQLFNLRNKLIYWWKKKKENFFNNQIAKLNV